LRLVVGHTLKLALLGVAIGIAASYAATRVMATVFVGVTATDALTFATASVGLKFVALLAGYIPARRASRLSPVRGFADRLGFDGLLRTLSSSSL
jgi:putative ABC transport system permease protein